MRCTSASPRRATTVPRSAIGPYGEEVLVGSRPIEGDTLMERRAFLATLAGVFLTTPLAAEAQQAGKVYRIGAIFDIPPAQTEWSGVVL